MKNNTLLKYIQVKDEILRLILTGKYQKHDNLPSENEIAQHFQVQFLLTYSTEQKKIVPAQKPSQLLSTLEGDRPTAFVYYNDELAVQMLEVTRQLDIQVPEHLSIVGYDDASIAIATEIKLTTLTHPKTKMGEDAVEILQQLIAGGQSTQLSKVYIPELVVRESTKRI